MKPHLERTLSAYRSLRKRLPEATIYCEIWFASGLRIDGHEVMTFDADGLEIMLHARYYDIDLDSIVAMAIYPRT